MIRLGLVGCGPVGICICQNLDRIGVECELLAYDRHPSKVRLVCQTSRSARSCDTIERLLDARLDFLVEAASRSFLREHGVRFLDRGTNLIALSSGVLASDEVRASFLEAAERGNAKIYIPGGPPGIDAALALQVCGISTCKYTSLRNSRHPAGRIVGPSRHFEGTVREAMVVFDKTLNTAAVLAEASAGYDSTRAEVGFYDEVEGYELQLHVDNEFARLDVSLKGKLDNETGKLPYFAAFSVLALLSKLSSRLVVGI